MSETEKLKLTEDMKAEAFSDLSNNYRVPVTIQAPALPKPQAYKVSR